MPLTLPPADTAPGPYEVQASLLDTSTTPAHHGRHDVPALHGGRHRRQPRLRHPAQPASGSGGPADPRGVALNAQLGLSGLRSLTTVDWSSVLPNCNASAPDGGHLRARRP